MIAVEGLSVRAGAFTVEGVSFTVRTGEYAVLMGRTFFNAYLAGQGTEWEKLAEDQYDQLFHEAMNAVGVGVMLGFGTPRMSPLTHLRPSGMLGFCAAKSRG